MLVNPYYSEAGLLTEGEGGHGDNVGSSNIV